MNKTGRPLVVNKKVLEGDEYADVMFMGDIHAGYPTCLFSKVESDVDYCLRTGTYVLGTGDYMECGLRGSVGDSVYSQKLSPEEQKQKIKELFKPLADAGLLLGMLEGNHENRITKETGLNVTRDIADYLRVPYLGMAKYNWFKVGEQNYVIYAMHGSSGATNSATKLTAAIKASASHNFDVFVMGHVHDKVSDTILEQYVDFRQKTLKVREKLIVVTGHYLGYNESYAQAKGLTLGKPGSQIVRFYKDEHKFKLL